MAKLKVYMSNFKGAEESMRKAEGKLEKVESINNRLSYLLAKSSVLLWSAR